MKSLKLSAILLAVFLAAGHPADANLFKRCIAVFKKKADVEKANREIVWPPPSRTYPDDAQTLVQEGELQRAIWNTREKSAQRATELENEIASMLENASIGTEVKRLTAGSTYRKLVNVTMFTNTGMLQAKAVFKTFNPEAEVAAFKMSRFLGLNKVPVTVLKMHEGKAGMLQLYVDDAKNGVELGLDGFGAHKSASLEIFDYLIGNVDRGMHMNEGNFLFTLDEKRLVAIDHAESFNQIPQLANLNPRFHFEALDEEAKALLEKIKTLNEDNLTEVIGDLLGPKAIKDILYRRDKILARLQN